MCSSRRCCTCLDSCVKLYMLLCSLSTSSPLPMAPFRICLAANAIKSFLDSSSVVVGLLLHVCLSLGAILLASCDLRLRRRGSPGVARWTDGRKQAIISCQQHWHVLQAILEEGVN